MPTPAASASIHAWPCKLRKSIACAVWRRIRSKNCSLPAAATANDSSKRSSRSAKSLQTSRTTRMPLAISGKTSSPCKPSCQRGLFGERSLFAKTLRRALSAEQIAKYDEVRAERRRFRYRASIEAAVATLENTIALRHEQREVLIELIEERTQPPDAFGQNEFQFVMYRLSRMPLTRDESRLDDRQWRMLERQLQGHRSLKQFLIQQGMLAKDGED